MDNLNSHTLGCEKPLSAGVHNYLCYGWVGGFQNIMTLNPPIKNQDLQTPLYVYKTQTTVSCLLD